MVTVGLAATAIVTSSVAPGTASPDQLNRSVHAAPSPPPSQLTAASSSRGSNLSSANEAIILAHALCSLESAREDGTLLRRRLFVLANFPSHCGSVVRKKPVPWRVAARGIRVFPILEPSLLHAPALHDPRYLNLIRRTQPGWRMQLCNARCNQIR